MSGKTHKELDDEDYKLILDKRVAELREEILRFRNYYLCPECKAEWVDEWSCTCDDECPACGCSDISPVYSEDID